MLSFHRGSCHCVCLVPGHVRNVGCFLVLALPSCMVNLISAGVAIQYVEVYFPCVGMWLSCCPTLSTTVLVPLVVSASPCSSVVVPLVGGWASSATSLGLMVVVRVHWDSAPSTAASIWLIKFPMVVGAAPLAPCSLYFTSFLAHVVLLRIWWRLLWGGDVDICGWWYERWGWRYEICSLYRL